MKLQFRHRYLWPCLDGRIMVEAAKGIRTALIVFCEIRQPPYVGTGLSKRNQILSTCVSQYVSNMATFSQFLEA